jgi:hypothetical protein
MAQQWRILAVMTFGQKRKTYNTRDSLVVTDPTTSLALHGLCTGERTGPSAFRELWSYVTVILPEAIYREMLDLIGSKTFFLRAFPEPSPLSFFFL